MRERERRTQDALHRRQSPPRLSLRVRTARTPARPHSTTTMDDRVRKGEENFSEHDLKKKKKKKKRRRREEEEEKEGPQQASLAQSLGQKSAAVLSHAVDEAAIQRRNEKNSKHDALAGDQPSQKISSEKRKKKVKKQHGAFEAEELEKQHFVQENDHKVNAHECRKEEEQDDQNLNEGILKEEEKIKIKMRKKKKEKHRENMDVDVNIGREIEGEQEQQKEDGPFEEGDLIRNNDNGEKKKKQKKNKERRNDQGHIHREGGNLFRENATEEKETSEEEEKRVENGDGEQRKVKKARKSQKEDGLGEGCAESVPSRKQLAGSTELVMTHDSSPKEQEKEKKKDRKRKRVTFQDQINVADQQIVRGVLDGACKNSTETVEEEVWGVRFTPEEDEILKDAVWTYIKSKGWEEQDGLNKVLNSTKHKDARNCWSEIKLCLPHRPRQAVRFRAHLLLENGNHLGKWSEEEEKLLKRLQEQHGHKWREISGLINRHRTCIKEKWRSLKRTKGKGKWTQRELQELSDLVHRCLRAKASMVAEKKKPDRHILRDNINWQTIADSIGTHNHGSCCGKWYYNLQSSLVSDGFWANEDDFLLLQSLLESGACVEEEVEWDTLLDHRPGQVCSTRWKQMVKHLGENRTRQFLDKLDILVRRYAPELLQESFGNEISIEKKSIEAVPSNGAEISDW